MISPFERLVPGVVVLGPIMPESDHVNTTLPLGDTIKFIGKGVRANQVHEPVLSATQLDQFSIAPTEEPFDGNPARFRPGIEAGSWISPTSTTSTIPSPSPASIPSRTSSRPSTSTSSPCPRYASSAPSNPAPASNFLQKLFREMYAKRLTAPSIEDPIVRGGSTECFRRISDSTLEGLARRELNLDALLGKTAEARDRQPVPEVIEEFFLAAGPVTGLMTDELRYRPHVYRVGKVPKTLLTLRDQPEPWSGLPCRPYQGITIAKTQLDNDDSIQTAFLIFITLGA